MESFHWRGNFINGQFVFPDDSSGTISTVSPADLNDEIFEADFGYSHVNEACLAARTAYLSWSLCDPQERQSYLNRVKELLLLKKEHLATTISRETGKPLWESYGEVEAMANKISITSEESMKLVGEVKFSELAPGTDGYIRHRSKGVLAVLGPFNFPGHLPMGHIVPALMTGNTVVFKPSEKTPLIAQELISLFSEAKFPPGVINLVQGDGEVGRKLTVHESIDGVLFTGSYGVGLKIKQETLNQHWKILALEMGGKNSSIVWSDVNLEAAIRDCAISSFITTGQRCSCTSRIFIEDTVYDKFVAGFYEVAKNIKIGHWAEDNFMGPLINDSAVESHLRFQEIAKREGAKQLMRGKTLELDRPGHYITPSVFEIEEYDPSSIYQKTEMFSPNISLYRFKAEKSDELYKAINGPGFGLALSVFSKERDRFQQAFQSAKVGVVNWNRPTTGASSRLPFGGLGKSGNGRPSGAFGVYYCTDPIASLERPSSSDGDVLFPGFPEITIKKHNQG